LLTNEQNYSNQMKNNSTVKIMAYCLRLL